jgi:colanic acid/amylovoran biosynthesis glycosyltransferase
MRVLHLWDNYAPGLFDRSFEICRTEGFDTRLVCMNFIARGRPIPDGVIAVREMAREDDANSLISRAVRKLRTIVDRRRFQRLVKTELETFNPDVLHVHYGTTLAALSGEIPAKPLVISFYGFDISQGIEMPAVRTAYEQAFGQRPLVHVLCDEARDRAIALGAEPQRVVDANLPLPVDLYPNIGMANDGPFRWLIPARFVEKKGHAVALRAFRKLLKQHPEDRLTCWGYGDPAWLENLVDELEIEDRVKVIHNGAEGPFDAAFVKRLREHDAILTPSVRATRGDDEGGPALTTVLAQVAGKPVIVSDFPGHERSVSDGVEGLVVPQGDADALAQAMGRLRTDRTRAATMGQAGRERALREFDEQAYRNALLDWYRTLAE